MNYSIKKKTEVTMSRIGETKEFFFCFVLSKYDKIYDYKKQRFFINKYNIQLLSRKKISFRFYYSYSIVKYTYFFLDGGSSK